MNEAEAREWSKQQLRDNVSRTRDVMNRKLF